MPDSPAAVKDDSHSSGSSGNEPAAEQSPTYAPIIFDVAGQTMPFPAEMFREHVEELYDSTTAPDGTADDAARAADHELRRYRQRFREQLEAAASAAAPMVATIGALSTWPVRTTRMSAVDWLRLLNGSPRENGLCQYRASPTDAPGDIVAAALALPPVPGQITDHYDFLVQVARNKITARWLQSDRPAMATAYGTAIAARMRKLGLPITMPMVRKALLQGVLEMGQRRDRDLQPVSDPRIAAGRLLRWIGDDELQAYRMIQFAGGWWTWDNGRWREMSKDEHEQWLVRELSQSYSGLTPNLVAAVAMHLRSIVGVAADVHPPCWLRWPSIDRQLLSAATDQPASRLAVLQQEEAALPSDPAAIAAGEEHIRMTRWDLRYVLATPSRLVHLLSDGTTEVGPNSPRFFTLSSLPYEFDPAAAASPPKWLEFLDQALPGEEGAEGIELLQEWAGYCLTPDTRQQKILLAVGRPRAGKGTVARVLTGMLGAANVAAPTLAAFSTNFGLQELLGKSLAIIGDARVGTHAQTAIIERLLSISGEDLLTIDVKHRDPVTVRLPTRLMLLSNELPAFLETSGALASRFLPIRFSQSFAGRENPHMTDELLRELPQILNWALAGRARLIARGRFAPSEMRQSIIDELAALGTPLREFLAECCEVGPGRLIEKEMLYQTYHAWCRRTNRSARDRAVFGRDLLSVAGIWTTRPRDAHGLRYQAYTGVGLRQTTSGQLPSGMPMGTYAGPVSRI